MNYEDYLKNKTMFFEERIENWKIENKNIKTYTNRWLIKISQTASCLDLWQFLKKRFDKEYLKATDKKFFLQEEINEYSKRWTEKKGDESEFILKGFKWQKLGKDLMLKDFLLFKLGTADNIRIGTPEKNSFDDGRFNTPEITLQEWSTQEKRFNYAADGWAYCLYVTLLEKIIKGVVEEVKLEETGKTKTSITNHLNDNGEKIEEPKRQNIIVQSVQKLQEDKIKFDLKEYDLTTNNVCPYFPEPIFDGNYYSIYEGATGNNRFQYFKVPEMSNAGTLCKQFIEKYNFKNEYRYKYYEDAIKLIDASKIDATYKEIGLDAYMKYWNDCLTESEKLNSNIYSIQHFDALKEWFNLSLKRHLNANEHLYLNIEEIRIADIDQWSNGIMQSVAKYLQQSSRNDNRKHSAISRIQASALIKFYNWIFEFINESKKENSKPIWDDLSPSYTDADISPTVFISYSWDSQEHEDWIRNLATKLRENGVNAILDKWDSGALGKSLPLFMEKSIAISQRVICVMTPNYKKKTENIECGVGYEYAIIVAKIFTSSANTSKFIPLIRSGLDTDSIPTALEGRKYVDMRNNAQFEDKFKQELLRDIYNEPKYRKPDIGKKPSFD